MIDKRKWAAFGVAVGMMSAMAGLSACSQLKTDYPDKKQGDSTPTYGSDKPKEGLFGPGGLAIFGGEDAKKQADAQGGGIGVNAFLWRASLDTIAFMPLASADPFGGVIITDWYSPPESGGERFKLTVFIVDRTLRADGVRVSAFRQVQTSSGEWADASVDPKTATDLENSILTRARELRTAGASSKE